MKDAFEKFEEVLSKQYRSNLEILHALSTLYASSSDRQPSKALNGRQSKTIMLLKIIAEQRPKNIYSIKRPNVAGYSPATVYRLIDKLRLEGLLDPDRLVLTEKGLATLDQKVNA
jgi:hypothetical protein